ncbi:trimethylamine-N-oxide reductase [Malaciobacter halophilus]|uniref:Trimethylamine-N-oxide reductase n=1 Tax=Malaciobacter halophilus TaxID=197482 RepID=A0A2N1J274_9BACT|nr:molybdopterin-dependent oxidoreductase [Malaciobacter halophilus]AXH10540.1 molybdopterin-containing oxidoreductase III, DMSO/TMAO/BSO reductase family, catalytic subunit [Malaciobacter halophilus]PKI80663.1 trimethylamine-N-oxide reductase [Malaciobacter halophilus]
MKRRDFIKYGSILGAATTVKAKGFDGWADLTNFDRKTVLSSNRFGMFEAVIQSGEVLETKAFKGDYFPSPMIKAAADRIQNQTRVEYPMVRKSFLKAKGPSNNHLRGKEEFVRVSWDVALDLAAKHMRDTFDKHGPESIYGECYWWGGSGRVSWGRTVSRRMMRILGGFVTESGDYSTGAGLVIMPHVLGGSSVYDTPTKWKSIIENAKNVVVWGCDPLVTNQITWSTPLHRCYKDYEKLQAAVFSGKIKAFSVDPRKNDTQKFLDAEHIAVKPNTDVALMIGMAHYLYTKKLYDEKFIRKYTVGFNKFKKYLLGKEDGQEKDIKWASKICGVDEKTIAKFATTLAKERTVLLCGRALQRQDHGEQAHWMCTVLAAMLGHMGLPGGGIEFSLAYNSSGATDKLAPTITGISQSIPEKYNKKYPNAPWLKHHDVVIPSSRSIEAIQRPGEDLDQNGKKIKLPHIRLMYNASGSPLTRHHDVNNMIEQWKKVDTVITAEPYWTSTAKMSDIVFPVATELERVDIDQTGGTKEYIIARKAHVKPAGESQSDFWICKELCKRWGYEEVFTEEKTELEWVKYIYEDAVQKAKAMNLKMPSFDKFWEKGYVRFEDDDKATQNYTRYTDFRENPYKHRLGTPSGKIEIYSPVIAKFNYDDCKGHPTWMEPIEWLGDKKQTKKYPMHIISPHSKYRLHSQLNNTFIRGLYEISGREPVLINPKEAKRRGLKTGDIARVFNDRGEILAGVYVTDAVIDEVAVLCEGAWYSPENLGDKTLCQHGNVNVLTIDKGTSKLAQSNIAHTALVEIEKFKGELKPINAFTKPKIVQSL